MTYKIILGYIKDGSKKFSRNFIISTIDDNELIFDNCKDYKDYLEYLIDINTIIINDESYCIEYNDEVLDITNNIHFSKVYLYHIDENEDENIDSMFDDLDF